MSERSIVCATSVAGGEEAFATLGRVRMMPEHAIDHHALRGVDVLITRSKVAIDESLLKNHSLAFYGTATSGTDHVDAQALARRSIAWAAAPGSNATSVAEYVIAALARLGLERGITWRNKTLAIVGAGHVGSRLARLAPALGLRVRLHDPPLGDTTGDARYESRRAVLNDADAVSLHVPLAADGKYPTRSMIDAAFFDDLKPGAVFINSSRGEVVADEPGLVQKRAGGEISALVLDVFHQEPGIALATLQAADIATPHIAGYSHDARMQGTDMIYRAACRHFGITPSWRIPPPADRPVLTPGNERDEDRALYQLIVQAYDPRRDDAALRAIPPDTSLAKHFARLRIEYPERREFRVYRIAGGSTMSRSARENLLTLGFNLD